MILQSNYAWDVAPGALDAQPISSSTFLSFLIVTLHTGMLYGQGFLVESTKAGELWREHKTGHAMYVVTNQPSLLSP